jgi:hypothetical protein
MILGVMVAQQTISRPPLLVAQMTEEWLNYYRKIAQVTFCQSRFKNPESIQILCGRIGRQFKTY